MYEREGTDNRIRQCGAGAATKIPQSILQNCSEYTLRCLVSRGGNSGSHHPKWKNQRAVFTGLCADQNQPATTARKLEETTDNAMVSSARDSVYNNAMPLPASLIASIVSAVIETVVQSVGAPAPQTYENYIIQRKLPPEAKLGVMEPPPGNGTIVIDGVKHRLSPIAQFRNEKNLIVLSMTIQGNKDIVYVNDSYGSVYRVWILPPAEMAAIRQN